MRYEEFRKKLAYIIGREHQFDFSTEEDMKLREIYDSVYEYGHDIGYKYGCENGYRNGYNDGLDEGA